MGGVVYVCCEQRSCSGCCERSRSSAIMKSFCRFISRRGFPDEIVRSWVKFYSRGNVKFCGKVWGWLAFEFDESLVVWLIGLVKSQLKIQLGDARLTTDELLTILLEIERVLNNRPITYNDPTDLDKCLTPNKFLFGRRLEAHSYRDNSQTETISQVTYWKHLTAILKHLWNQWRS